MMNWPKWNKGAIGPRRDHGDPWWKVRTIPAGDSFIMIGEGRDRRDDVYVNIGAISTPTSDHDLIPADRQDVPKLIAEALSPPTSLGE